MAVVMSQGILRRALGGVTRIENIRVNDLLRTFEGDVRAFDEIYRTQPAVRRVIGFRARNLAQLPLELYKENAENDFELVKDHSLAKLLRRPTKQGSPFKFIYALVSDLSIYDRTLWIKVYDEDIKRLVLMRVPPTDFVVEGNQWDIERIRVSRAGQFLYFGLEDVLYIDGYTPHRNYGGVPPLETLRATIAEEISSSNYRGAMWKNGARLEHVITRPEGKPMSPEAKDRFWMRWNSRYSGSVNAARTALLEEGMDIKEVKSYSSRDAQYIEGRKFNLEEVAGLFYIPPAALGILDNANYANMAAQSRQLYRETFGPDMEYLQQELMRQLGPDDAADRFTLRFALDKKIEASLEELAPAMQTLTGGPILTPNEARKYVKRPALPDGEVLRNVSGTVAPAQNGNANQPNGGQNADNQGNGNGSAQGLGTVAPIRSANPSPYRQLERGA